MIHIFKNLNFGGLLALVAGVVLMVSWTGVNHADEPTWYEVQETHTNPGQPESLNIVGEFTGGTPSGDCIATDGEICAVQLDGKLDPQNMPATVADAQTLGFIVTDDRHLLD